MNRVVILGAGRSIKGGRPSAMVAIDKHHRVLDWLLDSFSVLRNCDVYFIGGYRVAEVTEHYPDIRFLFNPDWANTGPVRSLALMPRDNHACTYVCYSDIVFRPEIVRQMEDIQSDVVVAIDSLWRVRYDSRTRTEMDVAEKVRRTDGRIVDIGKQVDTDQADSEFVGLIKISGSTIEHVHQALREKRFAISEGIPVLVRYLIDQGFSCADIDVRDNWAHLNAPQDLARFVLGTKAESLERLRPLVREGQIGQQVSFCHLEWENDPGAILHRVQQVVGDARLIVRSSALSEDNWLQSSAGAYKSLLDIPGSDRAHVSLAISEVIASYDQQLPENQVLIQEMVMGVTMSGVVMTRTPMMGSPYYVINFDTSGSTDSVTAGDGRSLRTIFLLRGETLRSDSPEELHRLLGAVQELESLVGHDSLDIEFALNENRRPHILQVRPIAGSHAGQRVDDEKIKQGVRDSQRLFQELAQPSAILMGTSTQFSVMADWNPAEMIGTKPQPLAASLYRHLITDETWARQRAEYGYRDVRPCNLMADFVGHPYIDMRADFNSFVPAALPDELAGRLVDYYLSRLRRHPELHDKVEFDVIMTCLSLDFDRSARRLAEAEFTDSEIALIRSSLRDITRKGIERCAQDTGAIGQLKPRIRTIIDGTPSHLERAYLLIEDARRLSLPLFAHMARHAFMAVSLLKSLSTAGVLEQDQVEAVLASMRTVPSAMQAHAREVAEDRLSWNDFVAEYGHLRPGSYDIRSACYADAPEEFLRPVVDQARADGALPPPTQLWIGRVRQAVDKALKSIGLEIRCDEFVRFLHHAIEGREFCKFEFMRGINAALEAIAAFGLAHGVERDDLAQTRYHELMTLRGAHADSAGMRLAEMVRRGREESYVTQAVCLPAQIFSPADFECFEQREAEPNFITRKSVRAPVRVLKGQSLLSEEISGCIVLVSNADPGYDWLFSRDIAGLITMYGGMNSHMAIRAAEFGLPAAIGIGELLYDDIAHAKVLTLDCGSRQIRVVR